VLPSFCSDERKEENKNARLQWVEIGPEYNFHPEEDAPMRAPGITETKKNHRAEVKEHVAEAADRRRAASFSFCVGNLAVSHHAL